MTTPLHVLRTLAIFWKSLPIGHRGRLLLWGLLLAGAELLIWNHEPMLIWFGCRFRIEDPLAKSDAIVVLLAPSRDRSERAAELFRQGLAPIVLVGRAARGAVDGTAYVRDILVQGGVPEEAIQVLPGAVVESTHDEAFRVRDYVRDHSIRRLTVVTTAFHTARSRRTFRRALAASGVDVRIVATYNRQLDAQNWYKYSIGIRLYLLEILKSVYYRLVY